MNHNIKITTDDKNDLGSLRWHIRLKVLLIRIKFALGTYSKKRRVLIVAATIVVVSVTTLFITWQTSTRAATVFLTQNYFRWYKNADAVQPGGFYGPENQLVTLYENSPFGGTIDELRLRMGLTAGGTDVTSISDLKLQFAKTAQWYDSNWGARRQIVFDNSASSEDLVDFPVLIKLNDPDRIDYDKTKNAGEDLRFTDEDGISTLSYEIESWNEAGDSYVWVKVPKIDAGSTTDSIFVYYDNDGASDAQSAASVWSNNYLAVWHLNESVTDEQTTGTHNDSLGNHNGTQNNNSSTTGQIAGGQSFDGTDDYIVVPSDHSGSDELNFDNTESFTISAWANITTDSSNRTLIGKRSATGSSNAGYMVRVLGTGGSFPGKAQPNFADGTDQDSFEGTDDIFDAGWEYITVTGDRTTNIDYDLYIDNAPDGSLNNQSIGSFYNELDLHIGSRSNAGSPNAISGAIDEVRISSVARSADWIEAEYLTGNDAMNTYNAEETASDKSSLYWQDVGGTAAGNATNDPSANTSSGTGTAWTNGSNAYASDDSYATVSMSGGPGSFTQHLELTGFGFSIPSGATISGIEVDVEKSQSGIGIVTDEEIKIIKGGTIGSTNKSVGSNWSGIQTYGSDTDLWGETWTASDINASNFGFAIKAENVDFGTVTAELDHVQITVYYTAATELGFHDNTSVANGADITSNLLSSATILEDYYESNPVSGLANTITSNATGEWDFSLSVTPELGVVYYFRLYPVDAVTAITHSVYPAITFNKPDTSIQMRGGTWFNEGFEQPMSF